MQDNPFADLIPQTPQAPGVIYGRPKQPTALELSRENRAQEDQVMQQQRFDRQLQMDQMRLQQQAQTDQRQAETAARAQAAAQRLPGDKEKALQAAVSTVSSLGRSLSGFKDDYLGLGAGLENTAQAYLGVGTPGQRDWWADFRATDNLVRNELFGASLTAGEKSAYASTTITPDMTPEQARINLERRAEIAKAGLTRYRKYLVESGYGQGAIDALIGDALNTPAPVAAGAKPNSTEQQQRPQGAIEFGNTGGAPVGAEAYQQEIETGIRNGTITNADQVAAVAAKYRYAAPDRAETEKMFEALRNGARYGGAQAPVYASVQAAQEQMKQERGDSIVDPFVRGVADTATLGLADEIAGIGNAIVTGGSVDENIALERARDNFDEQRNFLPRLGGQIAGGFALPVPASANTPLRLAGVGAGYGAGYGFGSADGGLADRLAGAAIGGAVGGGIGYAGGSLAQRLAGRGGGGGGGGNPQGRATYLAAQEAGLVDEQGRALALPADVGGPMTRRFTSGVAQSPFGAGPINRAAERVNEAASGRLNQIASAEGAPLRQEALGELGQNAAQGYIDRTGAAARRAYDGARQLAGDAPLQGQRAVANIDAQLAELAATSNTDAPLIAGLQRLRGDLANAEGPSNLTIDAIRRLRTSTRAEAVADGLRSTDYNRRAGQVLDALSEDIASQLSPEAAAAFRNADRAYAERLKTIDDVMTQIVGRNGDRSAEAVADRLIRLGRGDSARLRSFLNAVEPEEAGIIRGSLIQEMGRANSGAQNAAGDAFSLQSFLTNWDKMPDRTRDLLFRGEHRQAIEALARYAEGARGARTYANTSNTGGANNATGVARSAASGAAAVGSLGVSAVLENLTGRLLGSRRFAQWLARAPREPGGVGAWARRLGVIATREPALAPDIAPLQAALSQAPGRAAANQEQQ